LLTEQNLTGIELLGPRACADGAPGGALSGTVAVAGNGSGAAAQVAGQLAADFGADAERAGSALVFGCGSGGFVLKDQDQKIAAFGSSYLPAIEPAIFTAFVTTYP
jgi:hypothetical protein